MRSPAWPAVGCAGRPQNPVENSADLIRIRMHHKMFQGTRRVEDEEDPKMFIFKQFRLEKAMDFLEALVNVKVLFHSAA